MKKLGRIAGILYLIIIVCGIFSEGFVRSTLVIPGDAQSTVGNIQNAELLFRFGFVSDLVMVTADIFIAIVFFQMLKPVHKSLSVTAMVFRFAQAFIIAINLLHHFAVILILNSKELNSVFTPDQLSGLTMFFLQTHNYGYLLSGVFFGVSCIILSYLIRHSAWFPSIFGVLIGLAGLLYVADSFTQFLFPELSLITELLVIAGALIAEVSFAIWLTVKGAVMVQKSIKKATDF
ncbi:MAG: DUF4386 domain-containing protein [Balneola sp.]